IIFLILNYLTFFLHARNVSENTVYNSRSNDSFLGDIAKWDLLYAKYYTELDFGIVFFATHCFFYQTRIKINSMKVNY
ncbi:hypothetical protein COJ05_32540, partial [Bacillus cereus]